MVLAKERFPAVPGPRVWERLPILRASFVRYSLAGCGSLVVDFSVFALLTMAFHVEAVRSHMVSRPLGGLTCYLLNRHFTFQAVGRGSAHQQFVRFWCVFFFSLGLTAGLLALFVKALGMPDLLGKALAEGIAFVFNFLALKHWTFR
jgi:putative flippase GtrA